jgi:two-component system, NarL family, invasion response regulator UvrY
MNVLLVDDHVPTRETIKSLVDQERDLSVVAEAGTGEEALDLARDLLPDVVVMDIMLPGINGIEAARRMLAERPGTRILVLSNHSGTTLVQAVLKVGSLGYVRKNRAYEELIPAIRLVGAGQPFVGRIENGHRTDGPGRPPPLPP